MQKRILFVSFLDSFEENIVAFLSKKFIVQRLTFEEIQDFDFDSLKSFHAVSFGPGPGHVNEYHKYCRDIIFKAQTKSVKLIGICLGHQLLLNIIYDGKIVKCSKMIHGQSVLLKGFENKSVAKYNSWTVELDFISHPELKDKCSFDEFGDLAMFMDYQLLTMQFHPESVGTSCPEYFFSMIEQFVMHNITDERS